jgi:hypothetical protein
LAVPAALAVLIVLAVPVPAARVPASLAVPVMELATKLVKLVKLAVPPGLLVLLGLVVPSGLLVPVESPLTVVVEAGIPQPLPVLPVVLPVA